MGDLRPGNGGGPPPEDGGNAQHGLPDLPPEWGTIVIPDDPAELAEEADALRRELRQSARRTRLRRAIGLRPGQQSSLGIPVVIMTVAILTTLVSLLVVTWGNQPTGSYPTASTQPSATSLPTGTSATSASTGGAGPSAGASATALADLRFTAADGRTVRLGDVSPAVVLLVDGCDCGGLVKDVAGAVPPGVTVVTIARQRASTTPQPTNVVDLADPGDTLRTRLIPDVSQNGTASAVMVDHNGTVVNTIFHANAVADVRPLDPDHPST
jgi:hypothetical protein